MSGGPRQLTFPLDQPPRFNAEDFLVTCSNHDAHALLTAWPHWPTRGLLLTGPHGSGKSHLAAIWAEQAGAQMLDAADLSLDVLDRRIAPDCSFVVENISGSATSETILFHLMNAVRERGSWLVLTSAQAPNALWPRLPDLSSRLRALTRAEIEEPGDELVRAVLVKLFDDRQLAIDADVIDYLARRMERSLDAARRIVAALDEEGLALGRRITRPVAAAVLSRMAETTG